MADELYFIYVKYFVKTRLILSGLKYSYELCLLNVIYMYEWFYLKNVIFLSITLPI
jgi:hypothetical protein